MRLKTVEMQFEFPLPQDRLAEVANEMADLLNQVEQLQDALAAAKENAKAISKLMQTVRELGVVVKRGSEMRPVICEWQYDQPEAGLKQLVRTDTGEVVTDSTCEMSDAEKQGELFVGEGGSIGDGHTPPNDKTDGGDNEDPMNDPNLRIPENPE